MSRFRNLSLVALLLWVAPAAAQTCPSEYAACDNGGCCLASEHCCPQIEDGCCASSTPFCCGDGTCAATPSQCGSSTLMVCDGYDVPCGGGCAPAGSDCCDDLGHYCRPESMCTSDTSCVLGEDASLALTVAVPVTPEPGPSGPRVAPPYADPTDAEDRSCALQPGSAPRGAAWMLALGGLALVRRRRSGRVRAA